MSNLFVEAEQPESMVEESIEVPNSRGVRKSKIVKNGEMIRFILEDTKTQWDVLQRGLRESGDGRCFGWRNGKSNYNWINYSEFIKRAENFGSGLVKMGLKPGQSSNVGIYSQNCIEWVVTQFGCCSQSMVVVPLYDSLGPDACIFMIKQAEIEVIICDQENKARNILMRRKEVPSLKDIVLTIKDLNEELIRLAREKDVKLHLFSDVEALGEKYPAQKLLPKSSDACLICYTSGTTGDPKGAVLEHQSLVSSVSATNVMLGKDTANKEDTSLSYLPLAHIFEQAVQVLMLLGGGSIGFFSGDITQLADDMRVLQPTFLPAVPRLLNKLYNKAQAIFGSKLKKDLSEENSLIIEENSLNEKSVFKPFLHSLGGKLRLILSGGAPIYKNVFEFYTKVLGCTVVEVYGQSEMGGPCCVSKSNDKYPGGVGAPLPCCIMKVVDVPEMGYFSKNSTGEVCLKGYNLMKYYLKDPKRTAETVDSEGWLHTGDIGMWLPNGTLKIIDRKKNILKLSQGEYIAPEKIENVYSLSSYISQVFIYGDSLKSFLVAIVIPEQELVIPWCKENSKKEDWGEICKDPMVKLLIFEDMIRIGKSAGLLSFEQVKDIHLFPEVLTHAGGFVTPTSKLKRDACKKYFAEEIGNMYKNIEGIL
ncbi:long-chain-fatty-acid--CoA ligase 5 [Nephila pilipes]|uniref:long-chain-fatty-acid--CoA ligase n=1 Tax=Nephila pilipes TaxID=299642 RepID=A0A8X6PV71_NEPPI|nr:long-chain-fatty-acid--CoA ligase 5 [Nephila pilipes]